MDSEKNTHILQPGGGIAIQAAGPDGGSALPGGEAAGWLDRARSFFLLALISLALLLTWRPGVFRLSLLFSLGLPPLAESLAWQPPPAAPALRPQAKPAPSPAEWRLAANRPAVWLAARPQPPGETWLPDASPPRPDWRRFSHNPWNWRSDRSREPRRAAVDSAALPPQKSVPALRIGDLAEWPAPLSADSPPDRDFFAALLPIPTVFPEIRAENGVNAQPAPTPFPPAAAEPGREAGPAQGVPTAPVYQSPPIRIDWRNREITGPIADAYLTIYPKLKFVGL
ncbi:MAG: hypothetical protein LBU23_07335, partial [Planctomycetota bacterium]|nr:hypothetical protein [Planctomycetota bacterium]